MEKVVEFIKRAQAYAKFWVAFLGGVAAIIVANLDIPDEWNRWLATGIAIVTAFSVLEVPNVPVVDGDSDDIQ